MKSVKKCENSNALDGAEVFVDTKKVEVQVYYIKNQQDATLAVLFIGHCKITLHVSDASCVHHQEY